MVRTASHGFSTFLESYLEKARQTPEKKEETRAAEDAGTRKPAPTPPPFRVSGFFGSGM